MKGISLFFIYPMIMVGIGFSAGILTMDFFYPYTYPEEREEEKEAVQDISEELTTVGEALPEAAAAESGMYSEDVAFIDAAMTEETLNADTEYVLREADLMRDTMVETVKRIPGEYMGMNRKQFVESMEDYEAYPPLSELERGFVSLEIISFSAERVTVQMNYLYVQPSESFYLAVRDNEVIVLLEDKETVFINTGIMLTSLPEAVQLEIIQMLWVENEEDLYDFLEHYSS